MPDHEFRPLYSGWGHSECRKCGLRYRPRMSDALDVAWLRSTDGGETWVVADGKEPECTGNQPLEAT